MSDTPIHEEDALVFPRSPLSLLGMFAMFLRIRFSQGRLPWQWSEDANLVDASASVNGIIQLPIEAEFAVPKEWGRGAPALIIGRGTTVHRRNVLGDTAQNNPSTLNRGYKNHWGRGDMDMRVECFGTTYGESAVLGDIVQAAISCSRNPICQAMTLTDVSEVLLSPTSVDQRDVDRFVSNVDFRVEFERRWQVIPAAPVLNGVDYRTRIVGESEEYVQSFVLKNT